MKKKTTTWIYPLFIMGVLIMLTNSCKKDSGINDNGNGTQNTLVKITSVLPDMGGFDTEVIIYGSNFSAVTSENKVTINNVVCNVIQADTNQLKITIPKGCGSGAVTVTVKAKKATGPIFTYLLTPVTTTLAGNSLGYLDGQGATALMNNPQYLNRLSDGSFVFSDFGNGYIRRIQNNGTVTTLQTTKYTGITGVAQANNKVFVSEITDYWTINDQMFADGINVFPSNGSNHRITNFVSGNGGYLYGIGYENNIINSEPKQAGLIRYNYTTYNFDPTPYLNNTGTFDGSIAVAGATNILDIQLDNYNDVMYFLDVYQHRLYIRKITNYSKPYAVVTTLYNLSAIQYMTGTTTGDLNTNPDIPFGNIGSFFVENENKIYLGSAGVVRKIEGNIVSIVGGYYTGTNSDLNGYTDGNGTNSRFNGIFDIIEDANKNLIISDAGNNRIRKISFE